MENKIQEKASVSQESGSEGFSYHFSDGIAFIRINFVNEKVNTLKQSSIKTVSDILASITKQVNLKGVVIISDKPDCFIAGADINMLNKCSNQEYAQSLSQQGQQLCQQIESLPVPVVAAIDGHCLGGGLELAMACSARVCTDNENTQFALPEVKLGLLPGSGGTVRLIELIGLKRALPLLLSGKQLRAKQALKVGLVDEVVHPKVLEQAAIKCLASLRPSKQLRRKVSFIDYLLKLNLVRKYFLALAKKQILKKTKGKYPAPEKIISVLHFSSQKAFQNESSAFAELLMTAESKALRHLFFISTELKKRHEQVYGLCDAKVKELAVIGGGLMGCAIAAVSVIKGQCRVKLFDKQQQALLAALNKLNGLLNAKLKRRFISAFDKDILLNRLSPCRSYKSLKSTLSEDALIIEAVFEDLKIKQELVKEFDNKLQQGVLFASNTSSIPIAEIAKSSAKPENVIGMHYFSPVEKMPLVEIIPHKGTSKQSIRRALTLARQQGKTPIVVQDKAGFYVNRILAPYIKEVLTLISQGMDIRKIDEVLCQFGFPIGPCRLLDQVGLDIAVKIAPLMASSFGERFVAEPVLEKMLEHGYVGRKHGLGFYDYQKKASLWVQVLASLGLMSRPYIMNHKLLSLFPKSASQIMPDEHIVQRCLIPMLNEAARCLKEQVIECKEDGDIAAVMGMGFPPFLGGPFYYIEHNKQELQTQIEQLVQIYGEQYQACEALSELISD